MSSTIQNYGWLFVLFGGMIILLVTIIAFSMHYEEKEANFINEFFSCDLSSDMLESAEYQSNKQLIIEKTFKECLD